MTTTTGKAKNPDEQGHLEFWRMLAADLSAGEPLLPSLRHVAKDLAGTDFDGMAEFLVASVAAGESLSGAIKPHEAALTRSIRMMVWAGELGGVLDVIAGRIADGLADGSFGAPAAEGDDPVRFWRAFGRLLSSGVPTLDVVQLVAEEASGEKLAEAARGVLQSISKGSDMTSAMADWPGAFPEPVRKAVDLGERTGELDVIAFRIADAMEADDLSSLETQAMKAVEKARKEDPWAAKFLDGLLRQAVSAGATDIHFDPSEGGGGHVRMRIDGVLHRVDPPPAGRFASVTDHIRAMAAMDVGERRVPQDGIVLLELEGTQLDLRISSLPVWSGQRVVIRLIVRQQVCLDLAKSGMSDSDLARVRGFCELPSGLVIVTGPTGCGKTTTMYSMLQSINQPDRAILTAEDPVEYLIDGIAQTPVNPKVGMTFPRIIRHMLRQAPNVMMVGEVRDLETAELCVQAALTGHLLFTQVHTNTAADAIKRLLDIGIRPFLINAALKGVIAQRLVRTLCRKCAKPVQIDSYTIPPEAVEMIAGLTGAEFLGPVGCDGCGRTGYRGRTAIYEVLTIDDAIRGIISGPADVAAIDAAARAAGMRTMLADGLDKAARGETSLDELMRTAPRAMRT